MILKQHSIFITEHPIVKEAFQVIQKELDKQCKEERTQLSVYLNDSPTIPRKWAGYEFPLPLKTLSLNEFQKYSEEFRQTVSEYASSIANCLLADFYGGRVGIRVALVQRCKKSKQPGVLFFWER